VIAIVLGTLKFVIVFTYPYWIPLPTWIYEGDDYL
jgi:hypothetical protein